MIRITLKQMEYFEALAETLHFGRAAELVGVTQPALSAQIAEMETRLGVKLFERGSGVIRPTRAAGDYRARIDRILAEARDLENAAATPRGTLDGVFRLGIIPTIAPYLLPLLLSELRSRFPELRVEIKEAVTAALEDQVRHGQLDAMLAASPLSDRTLAVETLFEDPFLLAIPSPEAATVSAPVSPESLVFERLILLEEGHCLRDEALAVCGRIKPLSMASFGATSLTTLLHMVGHGLGVTLLPEMAAGAAYGVPNVALVPFTEPAPERTICLAWRKGSHMQRDQQALADAIRAAHERVASGSKRQTTPAM
jgi:LysR family transcriptional regulator, hydrogen peroxide-inducible genes activator